MSSNMRWVILSFGIGAVLAIYIITRTFAGMMDIAGIEDPLANLIPLSTLLGLVGGIITFIVLMKHKKASEFGLDVVKEIKKVTWPTIVETRAATFVVIVLVIIISIILGFFDYIFASLTGLIYS